VDLLVKITELEDLSAAQREGLRNITQRVRRASVAEVIALGRQICSLGSPANETTVFEQAQELQCLPAVVLARARNKLRLDSLLRERCLAVDVYNRTATGAGEHQRDQEYRSRDRAEIMMESPVDPDDTVSMLRGGFFGKEILHIERVFDFEVAEAAGRDPFEWRASDIMQLTKYLGIEQKERTVQTRAVRRGLQAGEVWFTLRAKKSI